MKSRVFRIAAVVAALAALGGAAYWLLAVSRVQDGHVGTMAPYDARAREVTATAHELRRAMLACLVPGQGQSFWTRQIDRLLTELTRGLSDLEQAATASDARAGVQSAAGTIDALRRTDATAREYLRTGDVPAASALSLGDGADQLSTIVSEIEAARQHEQVARTAAIGRARLQDLYVLGGAALVVLLVILLLAPRTEPAEAEEDVSLTRLVPPPASPVPAHLPESSAAAAGPPAPAAVSRSAATAPAAPDLAAAAALCNDLARVTESRDLPRLLERSATVLDASGIVIWMAQPGGATLRPALSHGYSAQALARMGAIGRDDDNAAAEAFRQGALRIAEGDGIVDGAIAAPLLTPAGCVGVMSAEIRHRGETSAEVQAVATILAAQLATLVPADAR